MSRPIKSDSHFCPVPSRANLVRRLQRGLYQITAIGLESLCSDCRETWPADTEFFHTQAGSATGLSSICKACRLERKADWRAAKRAA
ncbi:hypothetical protein D9M68_719480 [compost metagenome]